MTNQPSLLSDLDLSEKDDFDLILNNISESYMLVNKQLCITSYNKAAAESILKRYKVKIFKGFFILNIVPAERQPDLKKLYANVFEGKAMTSEIEFPLENGEIVYYENLFTPARNEDGELVGAVVRSTDITHRKKIEKKITESEERLRFAMESTNQGAWDWNMQTDEVIYSGFYQKMYGFEEGELENNLTEWTSRIHPDDKARIDNAIQEHIHSEEPYYETTYRLKVKSGEYRWIFARGKLLSKDKDGKPLRMIGTHTDVTKKMQVEEALRKMNERFEYATKASSNALWEWDAVSGEAYVSPTFTALFGWEADSNQRFDQWHNYVHPDDREETVNSYYKLLEDDKAIIWQAEYRFLKADNSYALVSDKAYIIRDDERKAIKVIGATQDITLQKKTETELSKSNERFDMMLMATNELLWEWDIASNLVYRAKEGLKKVYGVNDNSTIERIEDWMQRLHADDHKKINKIVAEVLNAPNHQTFEVEYRFKKDDGNYAYIYDRGILIKDKNDQPVKMIGAAQNISERKRLESELLQNELEYKKHINQATVDSQEQERGEIGKELHDNVNQVLTTTKLYLELALVNDDLVTELIKKSSKNITSVINEIRQLSRSLMDPSLGDLGIVDSINDLIENINLTRKLRIEVKITDDVEDLLNEKQKLTVFRIIQESLNNVIKHAKAQLVVIEIKSQAEHIILSIKDDGIGFLHDSVKKGAGLKNISNRVYLINGNFSIKTDPGKGCQIKISFPLNQLEKQL